MSRRKIPGMLDVAPLIEEALSPRIYEAQYPNHPIPFRNDPNVIKKKNPESDQLKEMESTLKEIHLDLGNRRKLWRDLNNTRYYQSVHPVEYAKWATVSESRLRIWLDDLDPVAREKILGLMPNTLPYRTNGKLANQDDIVRAKQITKGPSSYSKEALASSDPRYRKITQSTPKKHPKVASTSKSTAKASSSTAKKRPTKNIPKKSYIPPVLSDSDSSVDSDIEISNDDNSNTDSAPSLPLATTTGPKHKGTSSVALGKRKAPDDDDIVEITQLVRARRLDAHSAPSNENNVTTFESSSVNTHKNDPDDDSPPDFRDKLRRILKEACASYADPIIAYGIRSDIELHELARSENDRKELVAALLRRLGSSAFPELHQIIIPTVLKDQSSNALYDDEDAKPDISIPPEANFKSTLAKLVTPVCGELVELLYQYGVRTPHELATLASLEAIRTQTVDAIAMKTSITDYQRYKLSSALAKGL